MISNLCSICKNIDLQYQPQSILLKNKTDNVLYNYNMHIRHTTVYIILNKIILYKSLPDMNSSTVQAVNTFQSFLLNWSFRRNDLEGWEMIESYIAFISIKNCMKSFRETSLRLGEMLCILSATVIIWVLYTFTYGGV